MIDLALIGLFGAALIGAALFYRAETKAWRAERSDLLNRIMARSYTDFVYTEKTPATETAALAPEPPDKAWHDENRRLHPEDYPDGAEVYE